MAIGPVYLFHFWIDEIYQRPSEPRNPYGREKDPVRMHDWEVAECEKMAEFGNEAFGEDVSLTCFQQQVAMPGWAGGDGNAFGLEHLFQYIFQAIIEVM